MIKIVQITKKVLLLLVLSLMIQSCSQDSINSTQDENSLEQNLDRAPSQQFNAALKGKYAIPSNDSKAAGQAIVKISKSGDKIHYKLITANIENVLFAHFHMAPPGQNGGVVATLYFNPESQPSGPANGVLSQGIIYAEDVSGAIAGDLDALIQAIEAGNIYVNVHTTNFPPGEIRGWL